MNFGIDFGTTNSACIGIQEGRRAIKYNDGSGNPFPSLIIIDRMTEKVYCGRKAWMQREELSESCEVIPSVKTYLGTDKTWKIKGKVWTPEMVAAEVFLGLKSQVQKQSGVAELNEAVVSIPVGFAPEKRVALRKAAQMAGIEIKSFVSEPTAAFFCHYDEVKFHTRLGVFDWGGGTLDVSIIENRNGRVKELATGGIRLGGDDIDRKLAEWAHSVIATEKNCSLSFEQMPPNARDKLIAYCEQAKKELTYDDRTEIRFWKYGDIDEVALSIDIETFSGLIRYDVEKAIDCFEECLKNARISLEELDCILMVGGSVNLRPFIETVNKRWKGKEFYPRESDWSVAQGAAGLSVNPGQYFLAQSVGVIMSDDSFYPILKEGEPVIIDDQISCTFALVEDSDTANFIFSDGMGVSLGNLHAPTYGFFKEKIDLKTAVDKNLILTVVVKSQNRSVKNTWNFTGLRLNYQLPVSLQVTSDG